MRILLIFTFLELTTCQLLVAQNDRLLSLMDIYHDALNSYKSSFFAESYSAFSSLEDEFHDMNNILSINISFYKCKSAMQLFHNDAPFMMLDFLNKYPNNIYFNEANNDIAEYFYQKRNYKKAVEYYNKVDLNSFQKNIKDRFLFHYAYSLFSLGDFYQASFIFEDILFTESKYKISSKYYLGHIAYLNLNYNRAEKYFLELIDLEEYLEEAPKYLVNIYHQQKRYDMLISFGLNYIDSLSSAWPELYKILGEAFYNKKKYEKSIYFFEKYYLDTDSLLDAEGYYILGQAYYRSSKFDLAISSFNKIIQVQDSLAQNASYYLADCYLKLGDKRAAQNAFESASYFNFNSRITEHAKFNFAKLCYELGYPYADPTMILQDFINDFPNSEYLDEAYSYLVNAFLTHKDYSRAIKSMEINGLDNMKLQNAYQEVSYYRAVQLFNDGLYEKSIVHFNKALLYPHNKSYESLSYFWKGESHYRLEQFELSIKSFNNFQNTPTSSLLPEFLLAFYHIGYANFKLWRFSDALFAFESFAGSIDKNNNKLHDTYTRMGDCHYMLKEYKQAINDYEMSVSLWGVDADYSAYQIALAFYQLEEYNQVIHHLKNFDKDFPNSTYRDDVLYRMGESFVKLNGADQAINEFRKIENQFPNSPYLADAKIKIGLVLYNDERYSESINEFKNIVKNYPASDIAREAINNARSAYVDIGNVKAYADWLENLSFFSISNSSLDSTTYESAELFYLKRDFIKSYEGFKSYINSFPEGVFKLSASYYLGKSAIEIDSLQEALNAFEYVNGYFNNIYSLSSIKESAILYESIKNYDKAINTFLKLDNIAETIEDQLFAKQGLMRCYIETAEYDLAIREAQLVLNSGRVDESLILELNTFIARSAFLNLDRVLALEKYLIIEQESQGELKAESMFHIAYLKFYKGDIESSKEIIFEQARLLPRYKVWLGKSFILLAKNYWHQNDVFQAMHVLDQLILNIDDLGILKQAKELKAQILSEKNNVHEIDLSLRIDSLALIDSLSIPDTLIIKQD